MSKLKSNLRWTLYSLQDASPVVVAGIMRHEGITGKRKSVTQCPIAVFLARKLNVKTVVVGPTDVTAYGGWFKGDVREPLPDSVRQFIAMFDSGTSFEDLQS